MEIKYHEGILHLSVQLSLQKLTLLFSSKCGRSDRSMLEIDLYDVGGEKEILQGESFVMIGRMFDQNRKLCAIYGMLSQ